MPNNSHPELDLRPIPPWWPNITFFFPCVQRILVATDGGLSYDPSSGFGLSRFVDQLSRTFPQPRITKAHRGNDPTADIQRFRFDTAATPVTAANYDQIWLFGAAETPVGPSVGSTLTRRSR